MKIAILSLLFIASLVRADFDPTRWQFRRPLAVAESQQLCIVALDRTVYVNSRPDLADLRVTRGDHEVPYVLESLAGSLQQSELRAGILDRAILPGAGLQLTLDLGTPAKHNRLRISTTGKNFRTKVRIETSADGARWSVARSDGYVFDFSEAARRISVLSVEYPLSTRRYLRATFFGWTREDAVTDAWLTHYQERPASWQVVAAAEPLRTEDRGTSLLALDLGAAHLPHSRIRIETDSAPFHRACEIETGADGKDWRAVGTGVLYRFPEDESLAVVFAEQHDRYLRLRIFNGDDRPLAVRRVVFETVQRRVKYLAPAPAEYALYYGSPGARPPVYDLAAILARSEPAPELIVSAGAQQRNPAYRPPLPPTKPWSERHPALLYGTLAAAIFGMGYITVRFLLNVKRDSV